MITCGSVQSKELSEWLCCLQNTQLSEVTGHRLRHGGEGVVITVNMLSGHAATTTLKSDGCSAWGLQLNTTSELHQNLLIPIIKTSKINDRR